MTPSHLPQLFRSAFLTLLGAIAVASIAPVFSAQPLPNVGEVVSLPPLMVEEKGNPLVWRYLATPTLEIISVCDDSTIVAFAKRYHRLEELLQEIVPTRFLARKAGLEANIIFNEKTGRARSQEVIAEMLQRPAKGAIGAAFPSRPGSPDLPGPMPRIRFLPNMRVSDLDTVAVFSIFEDSAANASHFTFSEERVATLLQDRIPRLPDWFVVGTVGLFKATDFADDDLTVNPARWESIEQTALLRSNANSPRSFLPIEEMLTRRGPLAGTAPTEMDQLWSAQSELFVRWAVAENKGARREALWNFVERLEKEPLTEKLFQSCFGLGFADARDRLSDYLSNAVNQRLQIKSAKSVPLQRPRVRLATDGEVARIRGAWERMEISYVRKQFPSVVDKYIEQARTTLYRAYDRNDRDPRLLAEIGLTEIEAGNPKIAREFLEAAIAAKVARPSAYYHLALLRFNALAPGALKLSAAQSEDVLAPLLAARQFDPPLLESCLLMSEVLKLSAEPLTAAQLAPFNQDVPLFAHIPTLVGRAVSFNLTLGQVAAAMEFVDAGQRAARETSLRERYQQLREELTALKR